MWSISNHQSQPRVPFCQIRMVLPKVNLHLCRCHRARWSQCMFMNCNCDNLVSLWPIHWKKPGIVIRLHCLITNRYQRGHSSGFSTASCCGSRALPGCLIHITRPVRFMYNFRGNTWNGQSNTITQRYLDTVTTLQWPSCRPWRYNITIIDFWSSRPEHPDSGYRDILIASKLFTNGHPCSAYCHRHTSRAATMSKAIEGYLIWVECRLL